MDGKNLPVPEVTQFRFSGFNFSRSDTSEVTLTGYPAVDNAMFRVIRSAPEKVEGVEKAKADNSEVTQKLYELHQIPLVHEDAQMQVFGYVLVPWIEDYYGDIFDPRGVESAAHSFLKSVSAGVADGPGGVGENHWRFMANAHPIQSVVDYSGNIGGIPGGWWVGLQISNPETWALIKNGTYKGFSVGCYVNGAYYGDEERAKEVIWDKITLTFGRRTAKKPDKKCTQFQFPGMFGFPKEAEEYADPVNLMFPIDTNGRALAVTHYLLDMGKSASYTDEEVRFMVGRSVAAAQEKGVDIPDKVLERLGISKADKPEAAKSTPESNEAPEVTSPVARDAEMDKENGLMTRIVDAVTTGLKSVFTNKSNTKNSESTEEVLDMDKKELLEILSSEEARAALLGDLPKVMAGLADQVTAIASVAGATAAIAAAKPEGAVTKDTATVEPTAEVAPTVEPTAPVMNPLDPLAFLTALEKHSASSAALIAEAVVKALSKDGGAPVEKTEPTEDKYATLAAAIKKLDHSLAERASVLGSMAFDAEEVRRQQEEAQYLKDNPFDGPGQVFRVGARRAAVPVGQGNTAPVVPESKVAEAGAAIAEPIPSGRIDPNAHPSFAG